MAKVDVFDREGKRTGDIELNDDIFNIKVKNESVVYEVVKFYLNNQRQGTKATKNIKQKRGGGKKPWRQKGTGRARVGSSRSPLWVGGGRIFGISPKKYKIKVSSKKRHKALKIVLSQKLRNKQITVLKEFALASPKTSEIVNVLDKLNILGKVLFVLPESEEVLVKSIRNIEDVGSITVRNMNVYQLLKYPNILFMERSVMKVEEMLG